MLRSLSPLLALAALALPDLLARPAAAQDGSYDMDCAVLLCLAGGFPAVAECDRAYGYMINRITDHPPKSPFGVCSMADGTRYEGYDLDYAIGSRGAPGSYSCPAGTTLYLKRTSKWGAVRAFCYAGATETTDADGVCLRSYHGLAAATFRQLVADLTIEPGTASEWVAPPTFIETVVDAPSSLVEPCATAGETASRTPVGGVTAPPLSSSCLAPLAAPPTAEICARDWDVLDAVGGNPAHADRASCAKTSDGETVLAITSHAGEANSLLNTRLPVPGAKAYKSIRASVEFMLPEDFETWSNGRLAFGVLVGDASCSAGGCAPEDQKGAMIRAEFLEAPNGSIYLRDYSYHLDRRSKTNDIDSSWEGVGSKQATYGAGRNMETPIPKGEWITMTLDVTLNDPGKANGSSILSAYDASGKLIGAAGFTDVTYRPDSSWKFDGFAMTEKYVDPQNRRPSRTQSMYYRNYRLLGGDATAPGCSG